MTEEQIIKKWKRGATSIQIAKDYRKEYNKEAKKRKETKITEMEALAYVEPIIFEFETRDWRKENNKCKNTGV